MNLFVRQLWALIRKNLLLICVRRPIATFFRALAFPLAVVLVVAYCKTFFASSQFWGISDPHTLRTLKDGLATSTGHEIVGFVDSGMKGGAVSAVIESLSRTVRDAGKTPKLFDGTWDLAQECASNTRGASDCYGAVIFYSSPDQGSNVSTKGVWNYTIRGDNAADSGYVDVRTNKNGPEVYLLPLQRAVDTEIIAQSKSDNTSALPEVLNDIVYTSRAQSVLTEERNSNYLNLCIFIFGAIFAFTMIGIVYHMPSYVATERELGMSGLIDTMIPGGSNIRGRIVRQLSTYISFTLVYLPGWLAVGIVISVVVFPNTSRGIPVGYHIFSGLAFCSFSLFGSSFFKKAQLSGSIIVVVILVFAILPQVLWDQSKALVAVFSLLFPSANYTYFITGLAVFESVDMKVNLTAKIPDNETKEWRLPLYIHWIFLVIQIVVYPILAFGLEHLLFSTASKCRTFATPAGAQAPTVTLTGFCKTYKPAFFARIFKRRKDVHATVNMNLEAYRGQILCLLGPNGSGKSTTLNCISGETKVTSGSISIDPTGGLGYAPQSNVIWPELTVEEHIRIFSDLKCTSDVNEEIITELVKSCDLEKKLPAKAKTLSGGQKRKLQLSMMFAGGSAVCCVDEVSTGLDPISRRRIWEILLAERTRRTIIMTTHFLDEADYLADNIAIMYKGSLKAEGTAATLKNRFGNGYTIKVPNHVDLDIPLSGAMEKESSRHQMVYRVGTASLAAEVVEHLERNDIRDYQVSGPTMEELFLKATGGMISSDGKESTPGENKNITNPDEGATTIAAPVLDKHPTYDLTDGRPLSALQQWYLLFLKRFRILRRRYIPYLVAIAFAIVGAGVAPLLIKSFRDPMACPELKGLASDYVYRQDFGDRVDYASYVVGPRDMFTEEKLARFVDVYSSKYYDNSLSTYYTYGYTNASQLMEQLIFVDTYEDFQKHIKDAQSGKSSEYSSGYSSYSSVDTDGGIWLADPPTVMFNGQQASYTMLTMNMFTNLLSGVPISTGYSQFAYEKIPEVIDFSALMFMVYYGLIMACYPAFFALYPTNERISNVRSMQYSNGIRPLPLWLSHLAFDGTVVLLISVVAIALLSASTPVWVGLGYLFLVMFLYGIAAALISYLISMFAKSAVTAWFLYALGQVIMYFAYFGGLIGVQSTTNYQQLEDVMNKLYFGLAVISPLVSLQKSFAVGLGQFAFLCNGQSPGSIYLYGGPILYLILQILVLFFILLWWDNSFIVPSIRRPKIYNDSESTEMQCSDLMEELKRLTSNSTDLHIQSVSKSFGRNLAVDDVTFGVQTSEIFALLGPNGAGKSTIISMIRGDIKPSTSVSSIKIAGHSILSSPVAARANLGVCPQFDSADVLTVSETLKFFAKTRGVKHIDHNVSTVIAACGLEEWSNQLAQKLSGGTKRKLSLAVALVGNPRVLVLDEPSSALDANAKRNMWRTLQTISKGRAVVLTTHSMEEADALADRIGIVSSRMLAIGDREALKRRAGDAFHIHLVSRTAPRTSPEELQLMKGWIEQTFENAKISRETQGGQIRFEVPAENHELVSLIKVLEAAKGDLGVEFYSVGRATLDEVFENIVRRFGETGGEK